LHLQYIGILVTSAGDSYIYVNRLQQLVTWVGWYWQRLILHLLS